MILEEAVRAALHRHVPKGKIFTVAEFRREQMDQIDRDSPTISGRKTLERSVSMVMTEIMTKKNGELERIKRGVYRRLK